MGTIIHSRNCDCCHTYGPVFWADGYWACARCVEAGRRPLEVDPAILLLAILGVLLSLFWYFCLR